MQNVKNPYTFVAHQNRSERAETTPKNAARITFVTQSKQIMTDEPVKQVGWDRHSKGLYKPKNTNHKSCHSAAVHPYYEDPNSYNPVRIQIPTENGFSGRCMMAPHNFFSPVV